MMEDGFFLSEGATAAAEDSGDDSHAHGDINDFGIGTLVLAMALGTASRMYITHITG